MLFRTVKRILHFARPFRAPLLISVLALLLVIGVNLYAPMLARRLIDTRSWTSRTAAVAAALVLLYLLRFIMRAASVTLSHVSSLKTFAIMQSRIYDHLQRLSRNFFSERQTGELLTRMTHDVEQVEELISHALPDTVTNIVMAIGVTIAMFSINAGLACITVGTILPVLAVVAFQRKVRAAFSEMDRQYEEANAMIAENLQGMREIQLFGRQGFESGRIGDKLRAEAKASIKAIGYYNFLSPGVEFFTSIGQVAVIAAGGYMTATGALTAGDVVAFLLYIGLFYAPVAALSNTLQTIQKALAGCLRAFEVLDQPVTIEDGPRRAERLRGDIEFEGVSFSYEGGKRILEDISLRIPAGQTVAVIGATGAGKTTLLNLIIRMFDPQGGRIRIDGVDIREYGLQGLRGNVAIVSQDVFLFSGTILENIAYSKPGATSEEVRDAARLANIHEFIVGLKDGYDTRVGEKGMKLSGGQRQRLAIARAILRDAPILLLDEATSAVDERTEREIRTAIAGISAGKTVVIVTHRMASIADADRVITLQNGRIWADEARLPA